MGDTNFGTDPNGMHSDEFLARTCATSSKAAAVAVFNESAEVALDLTMLVKSASPSDAEVERPIPAALATEMRRVGATLIGLIKRGDAPAGYCWDEATGEYVAEDGTATLAKAAPPAPVALSKESRERLDADLGQMQDRLVALRKSVSEAPEGDEALLAPAVATELHALGRGLGLALQRTPSSTSAGFLTLPADADMPALAKAAQEMVMHPTQRDAIGARLSRVAESLTIALRDINRMDERPDSLAPDSNGIPIFTAKSAVECGNELLAIAQEYATLTPVTIETAPASPAAAEAPVVIAASAEPEVAPPAPAADAVSEPVAASGPVVAPEPVVAPAVDLAALIKSAVAEATAPIAAQLAATEQALAKSNEKVEALAKQSPPLAALEPGQPLAKSDSDPAVVGSGSFSAAQVRALKEKNQWFD